MTELEMTEFMLELSGMGITGILIRYDGSGDSGQIEEIQYCTEPIDAVEDVEDNVHYESPELSALSSDLKSRIEDFTSDKLLENIEDWYNNEGGFGTVSIMVPSGQYSIDNNIRIIEHENYTYEGNLIEKSAE